MDRDTKNLLIRLGVYGALGWAAYVFVLKPLFDKVGNFTTTIGTSIGDALYDLTHEDFVKANFADGVHMPDGQVMNIIKSTINDQNVFPKTGKLYVLKQNGAGNLFAVQAPPGTQYVYPDLLVVATSTGVVTSKR
jgi:hypothetical protein